MKYLKSTLIIVILLITVSCVPNRKYVYLQKNDLKVKNLPTDSVVRKYQIDQFEYKLQPNDIISVRFESLTPKDFDFLNSTQTPQVGGTLNIQANALILGELVDEEGNIFYPVVGKVQVAGFTVFQVQDKLQAMAAQYLESPVVKVRLLNYRATILGEVNKEGTVVINNNRVSVLEVIGLSGGFTDLADKSKVKLIRQKGKDLEVVYINLLDEDFVLSPYYYIYQNDILIVPALGQRPYRKYFGQNVSTILSIISVLSTVSILALTYLVSKQ